MWQVQVALKSVSIERNMNGIIHLFMTSYLDIATEKNDNI